jgi:hypothetical protein
MRSKKSLAMRYYQLKYRHAPTAKSGGKSCENSGKRSGRETGWKAGRCRHMQISELFYLEICDQAVIALLAATEVRKFPRR